MCETWLGEQAWGAAAGSNLGEAFLPRRLHPAPARRTVVQATPKPPTMPLLLAPGRGADGVLVLE
jgi:hypothetical protein